jgi:YbbR domain-containing protein
MQQGTSFTNNLLWFMAALGLAFFVWLIAETQGDPIENESFTAIPIQYQPDAGLIVTTPSLRTATVNVRAQRSVMDLLTEQDITVRANLAGVGPGTQVVPLEAAVAESRRAVVDSKPAQVTVIIERELRQQKPVEETFIGQLPVGYLLDRESPTLSETQVLVTGVESKVQQVERLEAPINLNNRQQTFSEEIELIPVDAEGNRVTDVTVAQTVRVTVEITQNEEIEQVFVQPDIDRLSLPSDYVFLGIEDYNPKTISVTGDEQALQNLPNEVQTEPIDLSNATGTFTTSVGIVLPDGLSLVEPGQTVEVTVQIEPREDFRQINNVPVEVQGGSIDTTVNIVPSQVTVLVRGPQPVVRDLTAEDIQVVVDVQGLSAGNYDLEPIATVDIGQIDPAGISVLPNRIGVSIEQGADSTPEVNPDATEEN